MMTDNSRTERLRMHYDQKYKGAESAESADVARTRFPNSGKEMVVRELCRDAGNGAGYLEIGAGEGKVAKAVADRYTRVILTEISDSRIERLRRRFAEVEHIEVRNEDIQVTGLSDVETGSLDVAVMLHVVEHLISPVSALSAVHRALKPGGRCFVETPNIAKWTCRLKLLMGYFPSTASSAEGVGPPDNLTDLHDEGHLNYFTYRSLERTLLEKVGFSKVVKKPYRHHTSYRISWPLVHILPKAFSPVFVTAIK